MDIIILEVTSSLACMFVTCTSHHAHTVTETKIHGLNQKSVIGKKKIKNVKNRSLKRIKAWLKS